MAKYVDLVIQAKSYDEGYHTGHCSISNRIKENHWYYQRVKSDEEKIRWSDTRTREQFVFRTPHQAIRWLAEFDAYTRMAEAGVEAEPPDPFRLILTDEDLISVKPMTPRRTDRPKPTAPVDPGSRSARGRKKVHA